MIMGKHLDTCYYMISHTYIVAERWCYRREQKLTVPEAFLKGQKIGFTATDYLNYTPWGRTYTLHELVHEFSNNVGG